MKQVWIVLRWLSKMPKDPRKAPPECGGVFTSERRAVAACKSRWYQICPAPLNKVYPDMKGWPGSYYPKNPNAPDQR